MNLVSGCTFARSMGAHVVALLLLEPFGINRAAAPRTLDALGDAFVTVEAVLPPTLQSTAFTAEPANPLALPDPTDDGVLRRVLMALRAPRLLGVVAARSAAPLLIPVSHVVRRGAQEEMVGPHARRIVAVVTNKEAIGDRCAGQLPGDAVGMEILPVHTEMSVSPPIVRATCPDPAIGTASDLRPKALRERSPVAHTMKLTLCASGVFA